ncbi:MAG TPA: F-box protein, partial [Spirochaetia bacterium]|nr:F-box protein [Spirochaetia bacterium]
MEEEEEKENVEEIRQLRRSVRPRTIPGAPLPPEYFAMLAQQEAQRRQEMQEQALGRPGTSVSTIVTSQPQLSHALLPPISQLSELEAIQELHRLCDPNRPGFPEVGTADARRLGELGVRFGLSASTDYASNQGLCERLREKLGQQGLSLDDDSLVYTFEHAPTTDLLRLRVVSAKFRELIGYVLGQRLNRALVTVAEEPDSHYAQFAWLWSQLKSQPRGETDNGKYDSLRQGAIRLLWAESWIGWKGQHPTGLVSRQWREGDCTLFNYLVQR